jgi:hypothetical protein
VYAVPCCVCVCLDRIEIKKRFFFPFLFAFFLSIHFSVSVSLARAHFKSNFGLIMAERERRASDQLSSFIINTSITFLSNELIASVYHSHSTINGWNIWNGIIVYKQRTPVPVVLFCSGDWLNTCTHSPHRKRQQQRTQNVRNVIKQEDPDWHERTERC